jgi:hypothetical protein
MAVGWLPTLIVRVTPRTATGVFAAALMVVATLVRSMAETVASAQLET